VEDSGDILGLAFQYQNFFAILFLGQYENVRQSIKFKIANAYINVNDALNFSSTLLHCLLFHTSFIINNK